MSAASAHAVGAEDVCLAAISALRKYALRWVIDVAPGPADAVIYDTVLQMAAAHEPGLRRNPRDGILGSAAAERALRHGEESLDQPFTLPATLADAAVVIHRYARRYTNGRGTQAPALVNDTALQMLAAGIRLDHTKQLDGTIWAADGAHGAHDGLTAAQRREALSVLVPTP